MQALKTYSQFYESPLKTEWTQSVSGLKIALRKSTQSAQK